MRIGSAGQRVYGLVLPEDHCFQVAIEALQRIAVVVETVCAGMRANWQ